jgi:broad specificity phosphatase PhoE
MGLVLLVRHGQASFGAEDYDLLSQTGVEQSRVLGRALPGQGLVPSAVLHGRMRRQRDTAAAMIEAGGWSVTPELDEGWNEFDHLAVIDRSLTESGEADGLDSRGLQRIFERATLRWSGGEHDADYDETWGTFLDRVSSALERACAREGVTLVVTSGGPIAVACARLVDPAASSGQTARLWHSFNTVSANASFSRVVQGTNGRRLLSFNEHLHLPRELVTYR